jgi:3-dehydroquinate dehydratase type I
MLCVTGKETTNQDLKKRLERTKARLSSCLQEIRLDAILDINSDTFSILKSFSNEVVVCCRPERQGGWYKGSEEDRLRILEKIASSGVAYLDIEADVPESSRQKLPHQGGTKHILSWHDFKGIPSDLDNLLREMASRGADVVKIAVTVEDVADCASLRHLSRTLRCPFVVIAMGAAGMLCRARYPQFGSAWTYVFADDTDATAPGQLSLNQALELGLPESAAKPFMALVGGPQIVHSPGPRVYNRLFRARGFGYSYLLAITKKPEETFALLKDLGALGLSITMPHKMAAFQFGRPDQKAKDAGAANTLRFTGVDVLATNTDIEGVAGPLRQAIESRYGTQTQATSRNVLLLGDGGAARAARLACLSLGLPYVVSSISEECARAMGADFSFVPWEQRAAVQASILINTTMLGGADQDPWPTDQPIGKDIVFDLALGSGPSRLLRRAGNEGATTIAAQEMWVFQGAEQMRFITGQRFSASELRECLS